MRCRRHLLLRLRQLGTFCAFFPYSSPAAFHSASGTNSSSSPLFCTRLLFVWRLLPPISLFFHLPNFPPLFLPPLSSLARSPSLPPYSSSLLLFFPCGIAFELHSCGSFNIEKKKTALAASSSLSSSLRCLLLPLPPEPLSPLLPLLAGGKRGPSPPLSPSLSPCLSARALRLLPHGTGERERETKRGGRERRIGGGGGKLLPRSPSLLPSFLPSFSSRFDAAVLSLSSLPRFGSSLPKLYTSLPLLIRLPPLRCQCSCTVVAFQPRFSFSLFLFSRFLILLVVYLLHTFLFRFPPLSPLPRALISASIEHDSGLPHSLTLEPLFLPFLLHPTLLSLSLLSPSSLILLPPPRQPGRRGRAKARVIFPSMNESSSPEGKRGAER